MDWWDVHMRVWPGDWTYAQEVNFLHGYRELVTVGTASAPKYSDKVAKAILGSENANLAMKAVGSALSGVNRMYSGAIELNFVNMVDFIRNKGYAHLRSGILDGTVQVPNCPGIDLAPEQIVEVARILYRVTFS